MPRDINERGRDLDAVLTQYMTFVKPAFEEFCSPVSNIPYIKYILIKCMFTLPLQTKKFADVIIPRGADNTGESNALKHTLIHTEFALCFSLTSLFTIYHLNKYITHPISLAFVVFSLKIY